MKYERMTDRKIAEMLRNTEGESWDSDDIEAQCYIRLAELEDKIKSGELISTVQSEQSDQEVAFFVAHNATVRKQAVEKFASSLKAEFYGDWQRGNISERTYNFIIGEILFVLSIEGYGE